MTTAVIWWCVFNLFWVFGMSGVCIQWQIIGNVFLFNVHKRFLFLSRFFYSFVTLLYIYGSSSSSIVVVAQICINILQMPYLLFTPYHIM